MIGPDNRKPTPVSYAISAPVLVVTLTIVGAFLLEAIVIDGIRKIFAKARWRDLATGERLHRNKGELLCLIHSEISEAMEGERKNLMDDKLPHRRMAEVELADALIRIFDYAGAHGYDLEGAYQEKRAFNKQRSDHKAEARRAAGGKQW